MRTATRVILFSLAFVVGSGLAPVGGESSRAADRSADVLRERIGGCRPLDLSSLADELDLLEPGEVVEQVRDWALLGAVGQLDLNGAEVDWFRLVAGLPPVSRRPSVAGQRALPHGPARLAVVGPGEHLLLVPAIGPPGGDGRPPPFVVTAAIRALDERRMLDGRMPQRVHVVVYTCDARQRPPKVLLGYAGTLPGRAFESPATGFVSAWVRDLEGLAVFLNQADDLLEAGSAADGSIHLVGRRYEASLYAPGYHRIGVADLAVIRRSRGEMPGQEARSASNLGFSLDPWVDARPLAEALRRYAAGNRSLAASDSARIVATASLLEGRGPFPRPNSPKEDTTHLFALVDSVAPPAGQRRREDKHDAPSLSDLVEEHRFQAPLYIGAIRGTEVGMTLYYTDLVAKLFAMGAIIGPGGRTEALTLPDLGGVAMRPLPAIPLAAFHRSEASRLKHGRLWWAPRTAGFIRMADGALRFAPVATTLFMKSKAGPTEAEVAPDLRSATFCAAWNHAYLAAADANPEYHRLNQVMKWSVVFMAASSGGKDAWGFLDAVQPEDSRSFRSWYEAPHAGRRLAGPERLPFRDPEPGVAADALAVLRSKQYRDRSDGDVVHYESLSGGVDTATRDQIEGRTVPPGAAPPLDLPPDIQAGKLPPGGGPNGRGRYPLEGGGTLQPGERDHEVIVTGGASGPIRSPAIEAPTGPGEGASTIRSRADSGGPGGGLIVASDLESTDRPEPASELTVGPATEAGIPISRKPAGIDQDLFLGERVARGLDLSPGQAWYTSDGRRLLLRSGNGPTRRWIEVMPGDDPSIPGIKVGNPGSSVWYRVVPLDSSDLPGRSELVPAVTPKFTLVDAVGDGGSVSVTRCWLAPPVRSEGPVAIHGESSRLAVTRSGELLASGEMLGNLITRVSSKDVTRLRSELAAGANAGMPRPDVYLEGPGYRLIRTGDGWVARAAAAPDSSLPVWVSGREVRWSGRDDADNARIRALVRDPAWPRISPRHGWTTENELKHRVQLYHAADHQPWSVAETPEGFVLKNNQTGESIDLGARLEQARRDPPRPADPRAVFDREPIVADTSKLSPEREAALAKQASEAGLSLIYWSGTEGASERLRSLALPGQSIEVRGDPSVLRIKRYGELLMELYGGGLRIDGPAGARLQVRMGHAGADQSFFDDLSRHAASREFDGDQVMLVVCNLNPEQMRRIAQELRAGGAKSVTFSTGTMDARAITLALAYLERNAEMIGRITPNNLPRTAYADARQTLSHALDGPNPSAALRESFGDRAADGLLLRDGGVRDRQKDIQPILEALDRDSGGFFPQTNRTEPLRHELAA
jgi:hypothetical protein